jgi:hypothetical protein
MKEGESSVVWPSEPVKASVEKSLCEVSQKAEGREEGARGVDQAVASNFLCATVDERASGVFE